MLFYIGLSTSCASQSKGIGMNSTQTVQQEWIITEPFNKLWVDGDIEIFVSVKATQKVQVQTNKNLMENLHMEVVEGQLRIKSNKKPNTNQSIHIYIDLPIIKEISAHGNSVVRSMNAIMGDRLSLFTSQTSRINLYAEVEHLYLSSSSGSELIVRGNTSTCSSKSKGGGSIQKCGLSVGLPALTQR